MKLFSGIKGILEYLLLNLGRPVSQEELMEQKNICRVWKKNEILAQGHGTL